MTTRERAEALGWVRGVDRWCWWVTPYTSDHTYPAGLVANPRTDSEPWSTGWRGEWVWFHATEDEALEHALLLLDVWLS